MRIRLTLCALLAGHFLLFSPASGQTLTAITLFSTDSTGTESGFQFWDTRPDPNGLFDLWIAPGSPGGLPNGLTTSFINGPAGSQAGISIPLQMGANRFTINAQAGPTFAFHGMNLFFNGQVPPDISVKAATRTGAAIPAFSANSGASTLDANADRVPGSGTLVHLDGTVRVTMTDFSWAAPSVFGVDRIGSYSTAPNGQNDFVGSFTLYVGPTSPIVTRIAQPWTDTGIDVNAGDRLIMSTDPSELVRFGFGGSTPGGRFANADGIGDEGVPPGLDGTQPIGPKGVIPDTIITALLGKIGGTTAIGTGTPLLEGVPGKGTGFVGTAYDQIATASGRLFLGYNDEFDTFFDNDGMFHTSVTVIPAARSLGDYNGNGLVDAADYTVWRDSRGATGVDLAADANGNNLVGDEDYDNWKSHFGQVVGNASLVNYAVPEPRALILLAGMLALISLRRAAVSSTRASFST